MRVKMTMNCYLSDMDEPDFGMPVKLEYVKWADRLKVSPDGPVPENWESTGGELGMFFNLCQHAGFDVNFYMGHAWIDWDNENVPRCLLDEIRNR